MNFSGLPARTLVLLVRLYQYTLRPLIGAHCRFHPHCSAYAIEALQTHGAGRGSWLAFRRVLRCNPWHPGGIDAVADPTPRRRHDETTVARNAGKTPTVSQGRRLVH
jgi:putative membrane protein insertion efficiency factor